MVRLGWLRRAVSALLTSVVVVAFCAASLVAGMMVGLSWPISTAQSSTSHAPDGLYAASGTEPVTGNSDCGDGSYVLAGYQVPGAFTWRYNPSRAPESVRATALATIIRATEVVASGANHCGMPATVKASSRYAGTTDLAPAIEPDGRCGPDDHQSVTGWGTLDPDYLAITCTYQDDAGKVRSSDTLINVDYHWFDGEGVGCRDAFDLMSVMVHERGHTFGLDHVSVHEDHTDVMAPKVIACDDSKRSLGYGDYMGLVRLYGTR